jgi:type I restriction enzyme R subunit
MDRRPRRATRAPATGPGEHILAQQDGKDRLLDAVRRLSKALALAIPSEEALRIRDDVAFFQAVRAVLAKRLLSSSERPLTETDRGVT